MQTLTAAQRKYDRQTPEDFGPKAEREVEVERELSAEQERDAIRVSSAEYAAAKAANPGLVVIVCSSKRV